MGLPKLDGLAGAWESYKAMMRLKPDQEREARLAFFAGAAVLFHGVMRGLSAGDEVTAQDMAMMDRIDREIAEFEAGFDAEVLRRHKASDMGQA